MQVAHHEIAEKLAFRDYLRTHPYEAAAYAQIKHRLAAENTRGIAEYIEGKDAFVKALLQRAMVWTRQQE